MLALADDAALARLMIAATRIPRRARRMRVRRGRREPSGRSRNVWCESSAGRARGRAAAPVAA